MEQLILHLFGDYVTQSDWMANGKTSKYWPAFVHATVYSLPFMLLGPSLTAFLVIGLTHFLIDRYRLAKYVCYAKNFLAPLDATCNMRFKTMEEGAAVWSIRKPYRWANCSTTGYPSEIPVWLATWLMIIVDNTMHLTINYLALKFL
jgi:hypothetical protein